MGIKGWLKNMNTIESFKNVDKNKLLAHVTEEVISLFYKLLFFTKRLMLDFVEYTR